MVNHVVSPLHTQTTTAVTRPEPNLLKYFFPALFLHFARNLCLFSSKYAHPRLCLLRHICTTLKEKWLVTIIMWRVFKATVTQNVGFNSSSLEQHKYFPTFCRTANFAWRQIFLPLLQFAKFLQRSSKTGSEVVANHIRARAPICNRCRTSCQTSTSHEAVLTVKI